MNGNIKINKGLKIEYNKLGSRKATMTQYKPRWKDDKRISGNGNSICQSPVTESTLYGT